MKFRFYSETRNVVDVNLFILVTATETSRDYLHPFTRVEGKISPLFLGGEKFPFGQLEESGSPIRYFTPS